MFAKKGKYTHDEIPAATQIFTPNWIVKYMVQNTIGRIYLDNNPWATGFKEQMKYLVEPAEPTPKDAILKLESVEDYKLLDNACGSGHILVEAFGLFYKMYLEEGYSSHNAIENILRKNLLGIDLDTRAKQLATFALLMTAVKIDRSFLECKVMPRVLDMPGHTFSRPLYELLREFYMGEDSTVMEETMKAFAVLEQADTLGSIMQFSLSGKTRKEMELRYGEWVDASLPSEEALSHKYSDVFALLPSISLILALSDKYSAVVNNPPYMGSGRFDSVLSSYIEKFYQEGKTDLFSVFMLVGMNLLMKNGLLGMINMQSWLFLSSFEDLRELFISDYHINSLIHLGPRTFDELSGEVVQNVAFIVCKNTGHKSTFFRLIEGKNCAEKREMFLEAVKSVSPYCYRSIETQSFDNIPGKLFGYWLSENMVSKFQEGRLGDILVTREGMATADNNRFLRLWPEVSSSNFSKINLSADKWYPYNKGGGNRKWYGLREYVVNWANDGEEIKSNIDPETGRIRSHNYNGEYAFNECLTWSAISSEGIAVRYCEKGFLWDSKGASGFSKDHLLFCLGLINSKVASKYLTVLAPTLDIKVGDVIQIPYVESNSSSIDEMVRKCISISKLDWDSHETSWDFRINEVVRLFLSIDQGDGLFEKVNKIEDVVAVYKESWGEYFKQLHENEEDLNRQFIEIYGLQDELTPDVPLDEITILQQGEISVEAGQLVWHNDVLAKQLLSYAIGCMMGRYRLDRPGLHIAYPNPSAADVEAYAFQGENFEIDDDGIIPLLGRDCPFDDNAYNRVVKFIRQVFGDSFLNENLNFIESSLGKTIENYFVKDFWKDHKKMYSNRPIYWLFSSKKGAFQCLAYMHRMNPYTAEAVRSKYLLPYIDFLKNKIAADMDRASSLSTAERKNLDKMQAALDECLEYEERLHDMADRQVRFDLDDGVVKNYALFGDVLAPIK